MKVHAKYGYLPSFFNGATLKFKYEHFRRFLLDELASTLSRIQLPDGLFIGMQNEDFDPENCVDCTRLSRQGVSSIFSPFTHCLNHIPAVCQTKLGLCLVLKWQTAGMRSEGLPPKNVVVDLIEGIPVPVNDTLSLYSGVLTSLLSEMPVGWEKVIDSHISRDRCVPDDFEGMRARDAKFSETSTNYVGVKLLSWGPEPNYHLRPGQTVEVEQFRDPKIRKAYIILKALIKMLKIKIEGYMLKKSVLGSSAIRWEQFPTWLIVRNAMTTPELRSEFRKYVKIWDIKDDDSIPLTQLGKEAMRINLTPRHNQQ